jgi:hypothetical protein
MQSARSQTLGVFLAFIVISIAAFSTNAAVLTEDFSSDPSTRGWKVFGNTNLARWNSTNHYLEFTWDSSQTNTYFYHPLGTVLGKTDDFTFSFDMTLKDVAVGVNPSKPYAFPLCVGLQNFADATSTNFFRGNGHLSPNLTEFAFFGDTGFGPTIWPSFWSTNSVLNYNSSSDYSIMDLPLNVRMHVVLNYTSSNKLVTTTITTNGVSIGTINSFKLSSTFTDYRVGTVAVASYSDGAQAPSDGGSLLAHGIIHSISVTTPAPPVQNISMSFSNAHWQAQFAGATNWNYFLESSASLQAWTQVASTSPATNGLILLSDTNAMSGAQFYRVRAQRQ